MDCIGDGANTTPRRAASTGGPPPNRVRDCRHGSRKGATWTGRRKPIGKNIRSGKNFNEIDRWDEESSSQCAEQWIGVTLFECALPSITFEPLDGGGVTDPASGEELKLREEMKRCVYSPFLARRIFEPLSKWKWGHNGSKTYRFDVQNKPTKQEESLVRIVNDTFGREKIGVRKFWTSLEIHKGIVALPQGECYVMVVAKIGYVDTVWLPGHGQKSNDQILCELPRTKVGGSVEYYAIVAEWQPPPHDATPDRIQDMEDLHYRMGPAYLPKGSFLGQWVNDGIVPSLVSEPHKKRGNIVPGQFDRRLVELFCGERSTLGGYTVASAHCDRVRVDKNIDLLDTDTQEIVVKALCSENTAAWLSLPCTGGQGGTGTTICALLVLGRALKRRLSYTSDSLIFVPGFCGM